MGRKHPILNKIRAHKGVDYAAPRGTPIKAAGDGKVLLAGRRGGYGNTVIIQHGNTYRTLYGPAARSSRVRSSATLAPLAFLPGRTCTTSSRSTVFTSTR
jgi:murein DD-endopeptidase MepM/ murein hydrolase activator NlpD